MREIKFRAWDVQGKRMIEWNRIDDLSSLLYDEGRGFYHLMQFTGLRDRNGKEIYEGDILQWMTTDGEILVLGPVKWRDEVAIWAIDIGVGLNCIEPEDVWVPETVYEVIGNIYENPELLEAA